MAGVNLNADQRAKANKITADDVTKAAIAGIKAESWGPVSLRGKMCTGVSVFADGDKVVNFSVSGSGYKNIREYKKSFKNDPRFEKVTEALGTGLDQYSQAKDELPKGGVAFDLSRLS